LVLTLLYHPLASFCHKVLVALYEAGTPFRGEIIDFGNPDSSARLTAIWPVGKFPVLEDSRTGRVLPESSIIIDYLDRHFPGRSPLLPADGEAALETRLWDRFFDNYVQTPMQKIVGDRLRPEGARDPHGVAEAHATLVTAYAMVDHRMAGRTWIMGEAFTLAECAAAPALFYAGIVAPFDPAQANLAAYFERLLERPSVRRVIDEARPYFQNFPYRDAMPARFLTGA
jgi:glutathione S-transferase